VQRLAPHHQRNLLPPAWLQKAGPEAVSDAALALDQHKASTQLLPSNLARPASSCLCCIPLEPLQAAI
jgi:hypothetical protein